MTKPHRPTQARHIIMIALMPDNSGWPLVDFLVLCGKAYGIFWLLRDDFREFVALGEQHDQ